MKVYSSFTDRFPNFDTRIRNVYFEKLTQYVRTNELPNEHVDTIQTQDSTATKPNGDGTLETEHIVLKATSSENTLAKAKGATRILLDSCSQVTLISDTFVRQHHLLAWITENPT